MVLAYDIKMLKRRAADADEEAGEAQSDADYAACAATVARAMADRIALFRLCPVKACMRARRCAGEGQPCLSLLSKPVMSPAREQEMIDDLYYDMQAQRLAAEEAGEA